jgi:hypothetical protein
MSHTNYEPTRKIRIVFDNYKVLQALHSEHGRAVAGPSAALLLEERKDHGSNSEARIWTYDFNTHVGFEVLMAVSSLAASNGKDL